MRNLFFWNNWEKPYRISLNFLLVIFLAAIFFLIVGIIQGESFVIDWQVLNIREPIDVIFHSFKKGFFNFDITGQNFILFQKFQGSLLQVNIAGTYFFLSLFFLAVIIYLSTVTALNRFWYIVAMGLFIIFMVNLKLEQLLLFDRIDRIPLIVSFCVYLPVSYYFHAINSNVGFLWKILAFTGITALFGIIIYFGAGVGHPFLFVANYGILGPLIITCAFILMISHEIISGFIYLITSSTTGNKNSLRHFLLITGFYLVNILLLYLKEVRIIEFDFYYINPYLLFVISGLIGFWGLKLRSEVMKDAIDFYPFLPILYLLVGIIAFSTAGFFFVTGNDPILEVIRDTIIYGHAGFGLIFFIYILVNFGTLLGRNAQVYKVMYKPNTMPYFTFRFAGIIAVVAMFFRENIEVPIYHSLSGYYNGIGDLYTANDDLYVAEQYYKLGSDYGFQNHRSNYALASLAAKQNDEASAAYYYGLSINKRPTEYAYINLSNSYFGNDQYFDGLFTLREGIEHFPHSGPIANNLGLAMSKTRILDSALYFFDQASQQRVSERLGKNNFLALVAKNGIRINTDSLQQDYYIKENSLSQTNLAALRNQSGAAGFYNPVFPSDSVLGSITSARLINYGFNSLNHQDEEFIPVLDKLRKKDANIYYSDDLDFLYALGSYRFGRMDRATSVLENLASNSIRNAGRYYNILGLMALEKNAWRNAEEYFRQAEIRSYPGSRINKAIAQSEAGKTDEALNTWKAIRQSSGGDSASSTMIRILTWPLDSLSSANDKARYQLLLFRSDDMDTVQFNFTTNTFENQDYRDRALLDLSQKRIMRRDYKGARELMEKMESTNQNWLGEYNLLKAFLQAIEDPATITDQKIDLEDYDLSGIYYEMAEYLKGLRAEHDGDSARAGSEFENLGMGNPYFIPGVTAAVEYFHRNGDKSLKAYNILVEAIQYDQYSAVLWEYYILECVKEGFTNYIDSAMDALQKVTSEQEYERFMTTYQEWVKKYSNPEF